MAKPSLRTHRKFKRLVRMLGIPEPYIIGHLECMWQVGYTAGDPFLGDRFSVEAAAEWVGDDGKFVEAVVACEFVDDLGNGTYSIHDLTDHAPDYVKKRQNREAERSKNKDLRTTDRTTADNGGQRRTTAQNGCPPTPAPAPAPTPNDSLRSSLEESAADAACALVEEEKPKRAKKPAEQATIPESIDTPDFRSEWQRLLAYRKKRRHVFNIDSQQEQLAEFASWGVPKSIEAIRATIKNGWSGIFEPKSNNSGRSPPSPRPGQIFDPNRPAKGFDD